MLSTSQLWSDSSRLSHLNDYLSWIGWGLTLIGVAITAGSIIIGQRVNRLTAVEDESQKKKIEALETATRQRPFKERLIDCLNATDSRIMQALSAGTTHFEIAIKPYQFTDLQKLAAEKGSEAFISFSAETEIAFRDDGAFNKATFDLKPTLLAK